MRYVAPDEARRQFWLSVTTITILLFFIVCCLATVLAVVQETRRSQPVSPIFKFGAGLLVLNVGLGVLLVSTPMFFLPSIRGLWWFANPIFSVPAALAGAISRRRSGLSLLSASLALLALWILFIKTVEI